MAGIDIDEEARPADVPGRRGFDPAEETKPPVGYGEDIWRSARSAAVTAPHTVIGQFGDYRDLLGRLADYATEKSGVPREEIERRGRIPTWLDLLPNTADVKDLSGVGKKYDWESQTLPGALAGGVTGGAATVATGGLPGLIRHGLREGAGAAAARLPNFAADVLRYGGAPGIGSTGAGQLAKSFNPDLETPAELIAGLGSAMMAKNRISPYLNKSADATAAVHAMHVDMLDQLFKQNGIRNPISAGERADSPTLRKREAQIDDKHYIQGREAVTRLATGTVGPQYAENAIRPSVPANVSPTGQPIVGTMERMGTETGQRVQDVARRNFIDAGVSGADLNTGIQRLINTHQTSTGYRPEVEAALQRVQDQVREAFIANGRHPITGQYHIPGEVYHRMSSDLFKDAKAAYNSQNPHLGQAYSDVRHLLDEAMDTSTAQHNHPDVGELKDARRAYRAFLTLEEAQGNSPAGIVHIMPAQINRAAASVYGDRQHSQGQSPFYWAPSAHAVMRTEPTSGTTENLVAGPLRHAAIGGILGSGIAGAVSAKHGAGLGDVALSMLGGGAGTGGAGLLFLKPIERAVLGSQLGKQYYGNQLMANTPGAAAPLGLLGDLAQTHPGMTQEEKETQFKKFFSNQLTPEQVAKRAPRRTSMRGLFNQFPGGEE